MKRVQVSTRRQWRSWLAENHGREPEGIWLVFFKKSEGQRSLDYEEAVEEALCFGWIDGIIKRIDEKRYCRKFTPRRDDSNWSSLNRKRVEKVMREGKMTEVGLAKIEPAKRSGRWEPNVGPVISLEVPKELSAALAGNEGARAYFESLAPSYRKQFIGWDCYRKKARDPGKTPGRVSGLAGAKEEAGT